MKTNTAQIKSFCTGIHFGNSCHFFSVISFSFFIFLIICQAFIPACSNEFVENGIVDEEKCPDKTIESIWVNF